MREMCTLEEGDVTVTSSVALRSVNLLGKERGELLGTEWRERREK